jgi:hypothetical protein
MRFLEYYRMFTCFSNSTMRAKRQKLKKKKFMQRNITSMPNMCKRYLYGKMLQKKGVFKMNNYYSSQSVHFDYIALDVR